MKITESELEVMRVLWREERPLPFAELRAQLEDTMMWKKSTIQTLITRLREKGAITAHTRYVTLYTPNISRSEYTTTALNSFIDKLFDGSARNLLAALHELEVKDDNQHAG